MKEVFYIVIVNKNKAKLPNIKAGRRITMMKKMKLTFGGKTFTALVDMEDHTIFSAEVWHTYNDIEDAPKYNFHNYVDEVLSNGSYYTSETFAYYNPWESDDCYQLDEDDEENMTGESWTFFIPGIEYYEEDDFFEQLSHLINQCDYKADVTKRNKKDVKKAIMAS